MNYKSLFQRAWILITSPAKAWRGVSKEETQNEVLSNFLYPFIGLCCCAVFLGAFFGNGMGRDSLQPALIQACSTCVALFCAFFASAYLVDLLTQKYLQRDACVLRSRQLVGYSMVVLFVLDIVVGLLPEFIILKWLLQFYTVKVVWDGVRLLVKVEDNKMLSYTLMVSAIILFVPVLIQWLFELMSTLAVNG